MSSVAISGNASGAGVFTIAAPSSASNYTLTLPTTTGTLALTSNVPAQIQPISATVGSSAMTITASALALDFRSTTLGSGTITTVSGTPASLTIPSTATLGTVSGYQSRLIVLAMNNGGTLELAVVNIAGGNNLTETNLVSTSAIAAGVNQTNTVYSNTARTNLAYRVIGYIESTQATAGTWATAPSTIQGYGGQALSAMSSIGYSQTWQDVKASRAFGTVYYNTTGRPIQISVGNAAGNYTYLTMNVNGLDMGFTSVPVQTGAGCYAWIAGIVPTNAYYSVTQSGTSGSINIWAELR